MKPPKHYTARDWIYSGPPIDLRGSELTDLRWKDYNLAVTKLLHDPASSEWLDEPIYQYWAPKDTKRDRH